MTASQLVPVVPGTIGNVQCLTVDGRTLHSVLGVRRDFSNWIKGRISKYGFIESQDFEVFAKTGENSELDSPNLANQKRHGGDRRSQEYRLTLDMSKELCMVENNEKGRIARRYFIECERRLLSERPAPAPESEEERKCRLARERLRRHRERKREQLALPAPKKDRFAAYIEQVEEFRARTHAEINRLQREGMELVDASTFGANGFTGFVRLFRGWLDDVAISPVPLTEWNGMEGAMERSPLYLIREMGKMLANHPRG